LRGGVEPTHSKGFNQSEKPVVLSEYERPQGSSNGRGFFGLRPQNDVISLQNPVVLSDSEGPQNRPKNDDLCNNETNLFTYSLSHLFTSKKYAFTLAEVLITLGIIGVVAAITLPTLVQNYKKQVYVNQLKKTVSTLEQGFKKMLADEGVDRLDQIQELEDCMGTGKECSYFWKYFKCSKASGTIYPNGMYELNGRKNSNGRTSENAYYLNDGSLVVVDIFLFGGSLIGELLIDINGDKKLPNKWGRDLFDFFIVYDGRVMPNFSKAIMLLPGERIIDDDYWRTNTSSCGIPDSSTIPANTVGDGCAARIIENGWKMDY
jgi:prepilin-type N-terminal cleavage/methylation domain-containing protein